MSSSVLLFTYNVFKTWGPGESVAERHGNRYKMRVESWLNKIRTTKRRPNDDQGVTSRQMRGVHKKKDRFNFFFFFSIHRHRFSDRCDSPLMALPLRCALVRSASKMLPLLHKKSRGTAGTFRAVARGAYFIGRFRFVIQLKPF